MFANMSIHAQEMIYRLERPKLGSTFRLVYYAPKENNHQEIETSVLHLIDSLDLIFSDYKEESELSQITVKAVSTKKIKVSRSMMELLDLSQKVARLTHGAFDVTIGSLTKLWRVYLGRGKVPKRRLIRQARRKTGYQYLMPDRSDQSILFSRKGMKLDFGGIAKGYIGDQIAQCLNQRGIENFLIDLGGDLVAGGHPPNKKSWIIQIPWASQAIVIKDRGVASSGPEYQFFVHKGKRYSHVIDPSTGWGVDRPFNTTIISDHGWLSDALASAAAILTPGETMKLINALEQVEGMIQVDGDLFWSNGFDSYRSTNHKK